ncbi:hypothetical protein [uncultured Tenacibaculum sp.]|uniref:hypothetical protein n=1 Tax=uncultured Tenacibaculum sp. TaxID=174713 RepID=UPI00262A2F20|nr:hypothetical protein [uncultured Tenacibaculum sp.]
MKKSILNIGKALNKQSQKEILGGRIRLFPAPTEYNFCCLPFPVSAWIAEYGYRPNYTCEGYVCEPAGDIVY